jgi:DNA-binding PadR family transcriptional regulator
MSRTRRASGQTLNLLHCLMQQPRGWHHGYELAQRARLLSGTLYPILMRLSDRGFLDHKWLPSSEAGKPPRHVYRLTARGVAHAREQFALTAEAGVRPQRSLSRA